MNVTCTHSIKRFLMPMLAIASCLVPLNLHGALLTVTALMHEQVGFRAECASQFGGTSTGIAVSSPLGFASMSGGDCITPIGNYFSFEGEITFTTLNGEQLFLDYSGQFTPTAYPPLYILTDSIFEITGGTGSFATATGGGIVRGGQNIQTGVGLFQLTGEIFDFRRPGRRNAKQNSLGAADEPLDLSAIAGLDYNPFPDLPVLGDYYGQGQNLPGALPQNELPEPGILALLGIGLAGAWIGGRRMRCQM